MRRTASLIAVAALSLGVATAPAAATGHDTKPQSHMWPCYTTKHLGSTCHNNGDFAWGTVRWCTSPNDVVVAVNYYGHMRIVFTEPFPATKHFFFNDPPFWRLDWYDHNDSESGKNVRWYVAGIPQHRLGQTHLFLDVHAYCDKPDGPR